MVDISHLDVLLNPAKSLFLELPWQSNSYFSSGGKIRSTKKLPELKIKTDL